MHWVECYNIYDFISKNRTLKGQTGSVSSFKFFEQFQIFKLYFENIVFENYFLIIFSICLALPLMDLNMKLTENYKTLLKSRK